MTDVYTLFPSFKKLIPNFLDKNNTILVIGDINDPLSLSAKILSELKGNGIKAIGAEADIDLATLPEKPQVCNIVTAPNQTASIIEKCKSAGIKMIWIELGSETSAVIDSCKTSDCEIIYQHSIIKELLRPSEQELENLGKAIS